MNVFIIYFVTGMKLLFSFMPKNAWNNTATIHSYSNYSNTNTREAFMPRTDFACNSIWKMHINQCQWQSWTFFRRYMLLFNSLCIWRPPITLSRGKYTEDINVFYLLQAQYERCSSDCWLEYCNKDWWCR